MNLLYKVAAGDGINLTVLVAYRMCFGAAGLHNKTNMDGTLERLFLRAIWLARRISLGYIIGVLLNEP
ncbi:hypothetical protein Pyn_14302 [Prunus yedoensis var. nudiflora]|uniref:Uncharacterized protein n=1 Tax=Prunus yedoensis var. nudiflora TaxID=2094558 RepID=A0A314XN43_PRUYE|nr:hypothetical protein Pyn_14302 [Prunus yedoensis var. nudiflora]